MYSKLIKIDCSKIKVIIKPKRVRKMSETLIRIVQKLETSDSLFYLRRNSIIIIICLLLMFIVWLVTK